MAVFASDRESTDLTLDKIVSETTTIPTMKLRDYFEVVFRPLLSFRGSKTTLTDT